MTSKLRTAGRLVAGLALALALAAPAGAQENALVISAGDPDGNYYAVAGRIRTRLVETGIDVRVRESRGSLENLSRLAYAAGSVNVAFTQADALHQYVVDNPGVAQDLEILADLGKECLLLIATKDGPIQSAKDLKTTPDASLVVGRIGSGPAVTWESMGRLDAAYRNASTVFENPLDAMAIMKPKDLGAILLVQKPTTVTPPVAAALDQPDVFRFLSLEPADLATPSLADGRPIYTFEKVKLRQATFDTLCTRALLVVSSKKTPADARAALARELLENERYIVAPQE